MKHPSRLLLSCLPAVLLLCQCSGPKEVKKDLSTMTLAQRSTAKPSAEQRSQFEKYIGGMNGKSGAGSYYQKQMHQAKGYGASSYAGQKQFNAKQSSFGRSKAMGTDMTYSMGGKQSSMAGSAFKSGQSRYARQEAREGGSAFSGGNDIFSTGSALSRSKARPRAPQIIETIESTSAKNSAYSEDEVKKLLGR